MIQNSLSRFPVWLLSIFVSVIMIFSIVAYLALRRPPPSPYPPPPPPVVVSECHALPPGMYRLETNALDTLEIQFDVPDATFAINTELPDMPPITPEYCVTPKKGGANTMEIANGPTGFGKH